MYYRAVPHSITKISPAVALNGRKLITLRDRINPHFCISAKTKNFEQKCIVSFEVGDKVLALNLRPGPKWLHGSIIQKLGVNVYSVLIENSNIVWKRHVTQLLKRSVTNIENDCVTILLGLLS